MNTRECVCIYTRTCMHTFMYMHIFMHMYIYMYTQTDVPVSSRPSSSPRDSWYCACMYVSMLVCVGVSAHMSIYVSRIFFYMHAFICMYAWMHAYTWSSRPAHRYQQCVHTCSIHNTYRHLDSHAAPHTYGKGTMYVHVCLHSCSKQTHLPWQPSRPSHTWLGHHRSKTCSRMGTSACAYIYIYVYIYMHPCMFVIFIWWNSCTSWVRMILSMHAYTYY
jgi:hypothetical protein